MRAAAVIVLALVDAFAPPQRAVAPSLIFWGSEGWRILRHRGPKHESRRGFTGRIAQRQVRRHRGRQTSFPVDEIDESRRPHGPRTAAGGLPDVEHGRGHGTGRARTGTTYYEDDGLPSLDFAGKKVAVFGCGDSVQATAATSATRLTSWRASSRRGTRRRASATCRRRATATRTRKLLRGDKFCGCPLDQVNEGDKTGGAPVGVARHPGGRRILRRRRHGCPSTRARRRRAGTRKIAPAPAPAPAPRPRRSAPRPSRPSSTPCADCCRT